MERPEERRKNAIDDLLLTGVWTTSRTKTVPSAPSPRPHLPLNFMNDENTIPTATTKTRRQLPKAPPRPVVEDEIVALAREVSSIGITAAVLRENDPPLRGTIEQQPIILESEVSTADAATLHNKINAQIKAESLDPSSAERRFVLIPKSDIHSPNQDPREGKPRRTYTEPRESNRANGGTTKRSGPRYEGTMPPIERRKSRTDLPSLNTSLAPDAPPFRRSTSAYAYTPTTSDSAKTAKPPASRDFLLSPEAIGYKGQGRGKGYFDVPVSSQRQQSVGGDQAATPVTEKRRKEEPRTSTPVGTPVVEKRASGGSDALGRAKYENGDKLTRPQQLSVDNGIRRSDRHPSAQSERLDLGDDSRNSRKSSTQSSQGLYTESDSDLADSSDSEKRRRKHHHHHRHHRKHHDSSLHPDGDRDRHLHSASKSTRSSVESKPLSRFASPNPSPKVSPNQLPPVDRKDTLRDNFPSSRESRNLNSRPVSPNSPYGAAPPSASSLDVNGSQKQNARTRSRRSSPVAAPSSRSSGSATPSSALPIPIPTRVDLHSPGESRRSPAIPQYDDDDRSSNLRPSRTPKPDWPPAPFQPPSSQHLERPVGSYRRYSQDIEDGHIPPLPPCPRTTPISGKIDWLTLPNCTSFNICPTCYDSTMAPTEFRNHFVPAPLRSMRQGVLCDFGSQPWYRIAWLLTRKERRRDLNLIADLAEVSETLPELCLGKHESIRQWYSVVDPDNGIPVRNFNVCLHCVKSIEVLLPSLKGIFVRTDHLGPPGLARVCDMRFDSKRFIHYFDALETMADTATKMRYPPDTRDLVRLAKRYAALPECPRDQLQHNGRWFIITQLPEFTVCPECYDEVVVPELKMKKGIPSMFNREMRTIEGASCQLYSPRMKEIFERAVDDNDYKLLASKARERQAAEMAYKQKLMETKYGHGSGSMKNELTRAEKEWRKLE